MSTRPLVAPVAGTGLFMAAYLLMRPYGDTGSGAAVIAAVASPRWIVAHICGALAIASFARLCLRLADDARGTASMVARTSSLAGLVLVLPYYGLEAFALHVAARTAPTAIAERQIEAIRNHPVAMTAFGIGLVLLAVAAVALGVAWSALFQGCTAAAVWPIVVLTAMLLPQFYLPAVGRMAYGVAHLAGAALLLAASKGRVTGGPQPLLTAA